MIHINEIKFKGTTPWELAMNEASEYWTNYCNESLSKEEQDHNLQKFLSIRYEIETGKYS